MTIGLNTIREIYAKFCSIITEDAMTYLCSYYEYKNKNVSTAAKSVINLVREINPYLLEKKFRGKFTNAEPVDMMKVVGTRIKGASLLGDDNGDLPVEMDRIFTDEDFKRMRKLIRKQEEDGEDLEQVNEEELEIHSDEFVEVEEGEGDDEESEMSSDEEDDGELEEIDWDDAEEVEGEEEDEEIDDEEEIDSSAEEGD
jgi:protein SDA1